MGPDRVACSRTILLLTVVACVIAPPAANAFDTGPHSDITRDAFVAEGFGGTAADVAVVNNWLVDLYSNASKVPQSGHASKFVEIIGSAPGEKENWPDAVVLGASRTHFDSGIWDVANVARAELEWNRLQRSTSQLLRSIRSVGGANADLQVLTTLGMGLHQLQDFYSHSNWIEKQGVIGVDGTDWSKLTFGLTPTWFDVPKADRNQLYVYVGESTGHKERPHGGWNTEDNRFMAKGVNKDWPGRPGYTDAYTTSYFATRQWVRAVRSALGDEALWNRVLRYANRGGRELDHDLEGALEIGMMTGHWQGQGEPCDPKFSLKTPCGARNGLGGDLLGARRVIKEYFEDRGRTRFRGTFEALIPLLAQEQPNGDLLPLTSTRDMQATTRFVQLRVTSMKGIGLRSLGDPGIADRADMFTRARIAGQSFQSGEINGRDSFGFGRPYAPFTFIKAIAPGASYAEPVTTMTVEIRTSSSLYSGTDDDVYLRISPTRRFALDKRLYNDFERGDRDTYSVPIDDATLAGLTVGDISRVQIEKSPDGVAGGWKLRGVKLVVNGRTLYARDGIDRWLEDNKRTWLAPNFVRTAPARAAVPITLDLWDEDSFVYGGNDHGDLNRYDRRKRLALAYVPAAPGVLLPGVATGGSLLSGRLGDGDTAKVTYTIETLTPTPAPPPAPVFAVQPQPQPQPQPAKPEPQPEPKPDLVISAMGYDETNKYSFTVTNQGSAAAGSFTVSVSGETSSFAIPGLAAGASATRTFRTACKVATQEARADSLSEVAETNESNNTRSFTEEVCVT